MPRYLRIHSRTPGVPYLPRTVAPQVHYELPWSLAELSCLCASGIASAAFAGDREALEATRAYNQQWGRLQAAMAFSAAIAIGLVPYYLLTYEGSSRK